MVAVSDTFLFPHLSWDVNSGQAGRKDCRPESAADQTPFHLLLLLSFPWPGCLSVTSPPTKRSDTISSVNPDQLSRQATDFWHRVRGTAPSRIFLCQEWSPCLQQFLSPPHYLGSNTLIWRFCSSTLYHQIALFSLLWDGSNTVLLVGKMVPLQIFLVAQISR